MNFDVLKRARDAKPTPNKIVVIGGPGVCKTTFGAFAPKPIFITALGEESGIRKLAEAKRVPVHVDYFPEISDNNEAEGDGWLTLLKTLAMLCKEKHSYETLVLDCFDDDGFLDLAYHHHDRQFYDGKFGLGHDGKPGFMDYQQGYKTSLDEIKRATHGAMNMLTARGMSVILLMHSAIKTFKNPEGHDFGTYRPNVNQARVWPMIEAWSDMVLHIAYQTVAIGGDNKGQGAIGVGGTQRVMYCTNTATHAAKNRHGLPDMLVLPDDHTLVYKTFKDALWTKGVSEKPTTPTPTKNGDN